MAFFSPYDAASVNASIDGSGKLDYTINPYKKTMPLFSGNKPSTSQLNNNLRPTIAELKNNSYRTTLGHAAGHDFYMEPQMANSTQERYAKKIVTTVLIDSRDRDDLSGPPNNYTINLGNSFEYVESIRLTSMYMNNPIPNINSLNDEISWSQSIYNVAPSGMTGITGIDEIWQQLIPTIANPNNYSAKLKSLFNDTIGTVAIQNGFYTISQLCQAVRAIDRFHLDIRINTHIVNLIKREEEIEILAIETTKGEPYVDIILTPYDIADSLDQPLIISDLTSITAEWDNYASIPASYLNLVEFWNILLFAGDTALASMYNTYEFISSNLDYSRYRLYPSFNPVPIAETYTECSCSTQPKFKATHNSLTIFSEPYAQTISTHYKTDYNINAVIGRGLPFSLVARLPFSLDAASAMNTGIGTGSLDPLNELNSLPSFLGLNVDNVIRFIHSNTRYKPRRGRNQCMTRQCYNVIVPTINKQLEIERLPNGEHIFLYEPYILLRIIIPDHTDEYTVGNNIIKTSSSYINNNTTQESNDLSNLFAKIRISANFAATATDNFSFNTSVMNFYKRPISKLDNITVQFLDHNGRILDLKGNHNFTIEISAIQDVLTNTAKDTRNGTTVVTGLDQVRTIYN
jgi:hypothetical protein